MTAAVREVVGSDPQPLRAPPRLGPAVVDPPHPAVPPSVAPVAVQRRTGWGYAIAWALGIGVGAIAAGAFVGFLVNGPPGHSSSHRTIADVVPPTPDIPPPTPQEIVGAKAAQATTPSQPAAPAAVTTTATAPAPTPPAASVALPARTTAAGVTLPPIPSAKPGGQPAPSSPSTPPAASPPPTSPPLSSADVREVQGRLRSLGFDPGPLDGSAGPMTAAAVTRYQEAHGLPPTGVADQETLAELRREPGSTPPPPPPPVTRPRTQAYQSAAAPPPRQSNPFLDALNRMFGR